MLPKTGILSHNCLNNHTIVDHPIIRTILNFEPAYQAGGIVDRIHFQIRHKRLQLRKAAKQTINIVEVVSGIEENTKFDSELNRWKYADYHLVLVG